MNRVISTGLLVASLLIVSCSKGPQSSSTPSVRVLPAHLTELRTRWDFGHDVGTKHEAEQVYRAQRELTKNAVAMRGLAPLTADVLDALEAAGDEHDFLWRLGSHLFHLAMVQHEWPLAAEILARIDPLPHSYSNLEYDLVFSAADDEELVAHISVLLTALEQARGASQRKALADTVARAFGPLFSEDDPNLVARHMRAILERPLGTLVPNPNYPFDRPWEWGDKIAIDVPLVTLKVE